MSEGVPEERENLCQEKAPMRAEGGSISEEKLEERKCHLRKKREETMAKRMQETLEEIELCLKNNRKRAFAMRMPETPEVKNPHLERESICQEDARDTRGKGISSINQMLRVWKSHQRKRNFISKQLRRKGKLRLHKNV